MIQPQVVPSFRQPTYASPQQLINGQLPPTKGHKVAAWMERWLVHGEGDHQGQPVRLAPHQRFILNRLYEFDPADGRLLHDRAVIGCPKGTSKTEDMARIGLGDLYGPVRPLRSPHVVVQAASYEQANNVYGAAKDMVEDGPLASRFATFDHELYPHVGGGIMKRRAAKAGTSDGALPTCAIGDELHEWLTETQKRIYIVQGKNLRKRQVPRHDGISGALQLSISTAGDDLDSLLGVLYQHGLLVASGEIVDPTLLFLWWEAPKAPDEDLSEVLQLREAILAADPSIGHWKTLAQVEANFTDPTIDRFESERYNLNRWVSSPKAWIADEQWKARASAKGLPPKGTPIVLGFDGSYNRDSTALVGWTPPGIGEWSDYGFLIRAWEKDVDGKGDKDWTVPRGEVDAEMARAFTRWHVLELAADPPGWITELEAWEAEFGTRSADAQDKVRGSGAVLRFTTSKSERMGPACDRFRAAVLDPKSTLRHDGKPALSRHVKNARTRDTRQGFVIVKDRTDSPRKIDAAIAAVIARQRAHSQPVQRRRVAAGF